MQKIAFLFDAGQVILSTFDLDEVLQRILGIARDYFQLQNVAIFLLDKETQELCVRSQIGWDEGKEQIRVKVGEGLTGSAALRKQPVYAPDVSHDERYVCSATSTRSEVAIPLLVQDEVVGVLDFQSDRLNHFDKATIELLILFSTQAAMALQNAKLYSLERQRARQLQAINAIAQQSTAVLEIHELLSRVCCLIQEAFQVPQVSLFLHEENEMVLRAQYGDLKLQVKEGSRFALDGAPWSDILASGGTITENDLTKTPDSHRFFADCASRTLIPLVSFGQTLGVLGLHSSHRNAFQGGELQTLESVADICATSIQNANYVERVKQLAYMDGLTGIFNRRYFELRIMEEIERAKRYGNGMSVLLADIDKFKKLNDDFGHLAGDEVLRQVSEIFRNHLRKIDIVCRYGGEEFGVLLPETSGQLALKVAEKLRKAVECFQFRGVPLSVTMSAGIAAFPDHGTKRDELVRAADIQLYAAKQAGRNRVILAPLVRGQSNSK